ncbi:DNA-binding SARP family transcriptional activator [Blastococcus colisei]|uniref:DNA-binding SARP family transcriptional activator n=2 Tax=Blastococcus colisei TaxID=1564162 RepID=A0A543PFN7_9ACTN|nr:BTAD domain-containing putative transcriptional regulator [Blastococcus colisei]TQN42887.1 DNA-binding SARP family transcriptional activator [Blastococcus colisei]
MDHAVVTRVGLLDGFTLELQGVGRDAAPELPRTVQRLIAHLSLTRRPARTAIAGKLWPEVTEEHAHGSLRSSLWRVHKVAPGLITVSGGTLSIARDVLVDVHELVAWARQALDPSCSATDVLAAGDLGLPGELLPGWYEDWVLLERERLRQLRMHALEALAEKYAAAGRYGEAVQAAYAAVRAEPLRESAHRTVVRVHLAEGNVAEAVRAYESFHEMLADEMGAAPTPQMRRLVDNLPGRRATAAIRS